MIRIDVSGSFKNMESFLKTMAKGDIYQYLDSQAKKGLDYLRMATPTDSGLTSDLWGYNIIKSNGSIGIEWTNYNTAGGIPVIILLQYGHGTGTGGYVEGRDIINPAIRPIFDQIAEDVWKAVTSA